jgi:hypothetical protein
MEDAINDLEEQTPKAVAYERCVTAIMLIPEMLGEKTLVRILSDILSFFLQVRLPTHIFKLVLYTNVPPIIPTAYFFTKIGKLLNKNNNPYKTRDF